MTISGTTGKWLVRLGRHRFMNSPCREVEFPVQVLECSVTKFIFHVDGESLISGCPTFTARLIRKDANTAEGVKGGKKNPLQMKRDAP